MLVTLRDLEVEVSFINRKFVMCRDEAARMWTKREAEWERERLARERLMAEVRKTCCCVHLFLRLFPKDTFFVNSLFCPLPGFRRSQKTTG